MVATPRRPTFLWNNSLADYAAEVGANISDPQSGSQGAIVQTVNGMQFPDGK